MLDDIERGLIRAGTPEEISAICIYYIPILREHVSLNRKINYTSAGCEHLRECEF